MSIKITSLETGAQISVEAGSNRVVLTEPSTVDLGFAEDQIASSVQVGNDLVVTLTSGEQIIVKNFFSAGAAGGVVSEVVADAAAAPAALGVSDLAGVAAGVGALGAVAALAGGSSAASPSAVEVALALINAQGDAGASAPSAADYAAAGVAGVTDGNLAALNAKVAASSVAALSAADVETLLAEAISDAIAVLNAHGADGAAVPTAADYATAGVTVVDADNLAAMNTVVAASANGALKALDVQGMVVAYGSAIALINTHGDAGASAPSAAVYAAAEVAGVNASNVAASDNAALTSADLQGMADEVVAVDVIVGLAMDDNAGTGATIGQFAAANVTGVDATNVSAVNADIAGLPVGAIDTAVALQAAVNAINAAAAETKAEALAEINGWDGSAAADLAAASALLATAGIAGTIVSNAFLTEEGLDAAAMAAIIAAVAAAPTELTLDELQVVIDDAVAGVLLDNMPMSTAANTAEALGVLGIAGVTTLNQDEIQAALEGATAANPNMTDSVLELQDLVNTVRDGMAQDSLDVINAYAADDVVNPAPTLKDYQNSGVVIPDYFADADAAELLVLLDNLNADVAATDGAQTTQSLQALLDQVAIDANTSGNVIVGYNSGAVTTAPAPTEYMAYGVDGVTTNNVAVVNATVADMPSDLVSATAINNIVSVLPVHTQSPSVVTATVEPVDTAVLGAGNAGNYLVTVTNAAAGDGVVDIALTTTYIMNAAGQIIGRLYFNDAGQVTRTDTHTLNDAGQKITDSRDTNNDGSADQAVHYTYNDLGQVETATSYIAFGAFVSQEVYTYNDAGQNTLTQNTNTIGDVIKIYEYTYDEDGLMATQSVENQADGVFDTIYTYAYNDAGQPIDTVTTNRAGAVTQTDDKTFYPDGSVSTGVVASDPDGDGISNITESREYNANGILSHRLREQNVDGDEFNEEVIELFYDNTGVLRQHVINTSSLDNGIVNVIFTNGYSESGVKESDVVSYYNSTTGAPVSSRVSSYNDFGQIETVETDFGINGTVDIKVTNFFQDNGGPSIFSATDSNHATEVAWDTVVFVNETPRVRTP